MLKKILNKEILLYGLFGVLTTLVNFATFWFIEKLEVNYLINNAISWVVAVVFAYVTNKLFVFDSKSWRSDVILKEALGFFAARLLSFAIEEGGLLLLVDVLNMKSLSLQLLSKTITGTFVAKVVLAVVVVILNYFFSKFFVFSKDSET